MVVLACVLGKYGVDVKDETLDTVMVYRSTRGDEGVPYCCVHRNNKLLLPVLHLAYNHVSL